MKTRDQQRATFAYRCVHGVEPNARPNYKILVNGLGANIIKSGLAAAVAFAERYHDKDVTRDLFEHLSNAGIAGLEGSAEGFPDRARELGLTDYMVATRETLAVVSWLKRALQALDALDELGEG